MNTYPVEFYLKLRENRILYYKNPKLFGSQYTSADFAKSLSNFLERVNSFPLVISPTEAKKKYSNSIFDAATGAVDSVRYFFFGR
jgi:hypothetical protein